MLQTQEMNKSRPSSMKRGDGELAQMKDRNNLQIAPPEENPDDLQNDLIPDELLFALTQMSTPSDEKRPTNDKGESIKEVLRKGPPANVWHHKSRRSTFRHLTDHPRSHGTGVGTRDVSYIYDLKSQQTAPQPPSVSKLDRSSNRLKADKQGYISSLILPDSIIPDEYHIVKSKAVLGLQYIDEKDTTSLVDVNKTLRIFPSLKPSKRHEAVQLLNTFEYMLQKSGFNDEQAELSGPSQVHHLLELVKKEQTIYDLAFSEIIRQVSVGCVERGQLLSKLRMKYADLISRIPRQIKSLHAEVLAQRALDRRLTEELSKFKSSIAHLTGELKVMKSRDVVVTKDAEFAEEELTKALEESQSNASLVEEYHSLYELQRKRLEENIGDLHEEKELWCKSALTLSKKVMDANSLKTSKKLNVVQKSWSRLAQHFGVFLDDHDTTALSKVESSMEKWHSLMFDFTNILDGNDRRTEEFLSEMETEVTNVKNYIRESVLVLPANKQKTAMEAEEVMDTLANNFATWDKKFKVGLERFSSDHILDKKELIDEMQIQLAESTESATKVFRRHKTADGGMHATYDNMHEVMDKITDLESQLTHRVNGENGLLQEMKHLHAGISAWNLKINTSQFNMKEMHEEELEILYTTLDDFIDLSERARRTVRTQQTFSDRIKSLPYVHLDAKDVMKDANDWVKQSVRGVEALNSKLLTEAASVHSRMTQWMVQSLLHLAPDKDTSKAAQPQDDSFSICLPIKDLHEEGLHICEDLANYTAYLAESISGIVELKKFESKNLGIEDQDGIEYNLFKQEARDWVVSAENVLYSITGTSIELTDPDTEKKLGLKRTSKRRISTPRKESKKETAKKESTAKKKEAKKEAKSKKKEVKKKEKEEEKRAAEWNDIEKIYGRLQTETWTKGLKAEKARLDEVKKEITRQEEHLAIEEKKGKKDADEIARHAASKENLYHRIQTETRKRNLKTKEARIHAMKIEIARQEKELVSKTKKNEIARQKASEENISDRKLFETWIENLKAEKARIDDRKMELATEELELAIQTEELASEEKVYSRMKTEKEEKVIPVSLLMQAKKDAKAKKTGLAREEELSSEEEADEEMSGESEQDEDEQVEASVDEKKGTKKAKPKGKKSKLKSVELKIQRIRSDKLKLELQVKKLKAKKLQNQNFKAEEINTVELQVKKLKSEELQARKFIADEIKTLEFKIERLKTEEFKTEEINTLELQVKKLKSEELQAQKLVTEEINTLELKIERLKSEEFETEEFETEEINNLELQIKKLKTEEINALELQIETLRSGEFRRESGLSELQGSKAKIIKHTSDQVPFQPHPVDVAEEGAKTKKETEERVGIRWQYYRNQLDPYAPFERPNPLRTDEQTDTKGLQVNKKVARKDVALEVAPKLVSKEIGYDATGTATSDSDSSDMDKYRRKEDKVAVEVSDFGIQADIICADSEPTTSTSKTNLVRGSSVPSGPQEANGLWNVAMTEYNSRMNEAETAKINSTMENTLWSKRSEMAKEVMLKSFRSPVRQLASRRQYGSMDGYLEEKEAAKRKEASKKVVKKKDASSRRNDGKMHTKTTSKISFMGTEDRKVEEIRIEEGPRISFVEDDDDDIPIDPNLTASDSRLVTRKEDCPREKAQAHTRSGVEGVSKRELEVPTIEEILSGDVSARKRFKKLNSLEKADVISTLLKKIEIPVFKESAGDAISATSTTKFGEIEIETLAQDENVVCMLLSDITLTKLVPPSSKLTHAAYEAIAKVDQLQLELIVTEKRAQSAEENVLKLQEQVVNSDKKIRRLEHTVKDLQRADKQNTESDEVKETPSTDTVQEDTSYDRDDDDVKSTPSQLSSKKSRGSGKKKKGSAKK